MSEVRVLVITGLSGAGKTQAVRSLEDLGYFCVDNLPPSLIPKFAELCGQSKGKVDKVALVIDIRGGQFFDDLFAALNDLDSIGIKYEILFLEASDEILINRFKETRRRHPLNPDGGIIQGIHMERERLQELRGRANKIIDTSDLKPSQLKKEIQNLWGNYGKNQILSVTIMSFGYKYGIPLDTDLLIDVRFLPNPYYVPELKELTGCDKEVQEYILKSPQSKIFLQKYHDLLKFLMPNYISEGKTHLVIAIGCTGGKHRSVALANFLAQLLQKDEYKVMVKHRDIDRKGVQT